MTAPLQGIRVVEMAEVMQGPLAGQTLADYGADVIKVERPAGDLMRGLDREAVRNGEVAAYFAALNRNKRSIVLDLKHSAGFGVLHDLLASADVFIHSYRPDAIQRLGLGFDALSGKYPALVYASASGWGDSGPLSHRAGQDMLAQAFSGMARSVADPELFCHVNPLPTVDFSSGVCLAQGILAALLERTRTGIGQHVSVNLLSSAISLQMLEAAAALMYDRDLNWVTQWWSGAFETLDGHVLVLGLFRENALALACAALGVADLSANSQFADLDLQAANKAAANAILAPLIRTLTTADAMNRFDAVDLLCSPMHSLREVLDDPQVVLNDPFHYVSYRGEEVGRVVGSPVTLSNVSRAKGSQRVPDVGEDAASILAELGMSVGDQAHLRTIGAVGGRSGEPA